MNKKVMIAVVVVVVLILASALFLPIILEAIRGNVKEEQNQEEVEQDQEQPGEDMNGSIDDSVKDAIDEAWQIATIDASYAYISAIENELIMYAINESEQLLNGTITGADGNHFVFCSDRQLYNLPSPLLDINYDNDLLNRMILDFCLNQSDDIS